MRKDDKDLSAITLGEVLPANLGPHQARVGAPGVHERRLRSVTLEEGKTTAIEIELVRAGEPPPAPARGWMRPTGIALTTAGAAGLRHAAPRGGGPAPLGAP